MRLPAAQEARRVRREGAAGERVGERLGVLERYGSALAGLRRHGVRGVPDEHEARQRRRPAWEGWDFEESITG